MPHKFNAARRDKFDKVQYRVINWAEYNESLRQRGDLTIWVSEEAQSVWSAPRRTSRGGQRRYSDLAIETCLMLRTAYHLGLRQTQGLMGSIGTLMGLDQCCPGKVAPTDGKSLPLNVLWPVLPGNDLKSRGRKWPPERSIPTRHNGG